MASSVDTHQLGAANSAHEIQQMYLVDLEKNYLGEKVLLTAKKFKIIRSAKLIQRWYRRRRQQKRLRATIVIQR